MAKANSVEAEIDRILREWRAEDDDEAAHLRRQILNAMRCRMIATERPGVFYLHLDFLQALKNAREEV